MKYDTLLRVSKKADISLSHFFMDAHISFKAQSKFKEEDFVPSYIRLMLLSFIEKELSRRDSSFSKKKQAFFDKAKSLNYLEKNGLIQVSIFNSSQELKINDFESQFVKIVL